MRLVLRVPADRSIAGVLAVPEIGVGVVRQDERMLACATARLPERHPAFGRYRYREMRMNEASEAAERGTCRLVFEPEAGDALAAEARGVLTLEICGGAPGGDGRLRRTERGVRVTDEDLLRLVELLRADRRTTLDLVPEAVPRWHWIARWRRRLSRDEGPSHEESSIDTRRDESDRSSARDRDDSATGAGWSPGGGSFGGAGSGGRWDEATPAMAKPAAVAAAIATGAAVAAAAEGARARDGGDAIGSDGGNASASGGGDDIISGSGTGY